MILKDAKTLSNYEIEQKNCIDLSQKTYEIKITFDYQMHPMNVDNSSTLSDLRYLIQTQLIYFQKNQLLYLIKKSFK